MAWHTLMSEMPPLADAAQYRKLYYDYVFEGKVSESTATRPGSSRPRRTSSVPESEKAALRAQVAQDRADPKKAAMRAESLARREARMLAAAEKLTSTSDA